jgi:phosphoribosyl 1,2-cyclic phosphodiesterase
MFRVTFWGVRGSIASPGPKTARIGGNTSCLEVRVGRELVILDGGTGLRLLGEKLLGEMPIRASMFFSHVHWDHIQGFPFFAPAFVKGNSFVLYGGKNVTQTLEETLAGQMNFPTFPVTLNDMGAQMTFRDLAEGEEVRVGDDVVVTSAQLKHPGGVLAYRLEHQGRSIVYATDNEHGAEPDPKLLALAKNADVLIYDAQYTPEEYAGANGAGSKVGWGHSTMMEGARVAEIAGVRKLILFHHDPNQDDAAVDQKTERARAAFGATEAAYEGLTVDVGS